jgi:alpha-galactosidase
MPGLASYVHQKGLKIGLYSSPGPKTCAGFEGSYRHEVQDAKTYAAWGFDYLKYDWCSYGEVVEGQSGLEVDQKPYSLMAEAVRNTSRDIVFSLCQYGMGDVWTWGESIGGNCWRTTGDITDRWSSLHSSYESQNGHEKYAGPGHWNDPDMLVVGQLGWGTTHPTHLTPNEQILHITMWSLLSAPLLIGCDLTQLDDFTRAVLTNDEVLDIDQDVLGKPAGKLAFPGDVEVWARPLSDGTKAVGLINPTGQRAEGTVRWSDLGLSGGQAVRDLWLHKDLGVIDASYTIDVPAHGAVLLKIGAPH